MFCKRIFLPLFLFLSACGTATPAGTIQHITIQYTPAAGAYIPEVLACTGSNEVSAVIRPTEFLDLVTADLLVRVGEPANLSTPAYQIGTEKILVVTNRKNSVDDLDAIQIRSLFIGRYQHWNDVGGSNDQIQVWVFPGSEDIQMLFTQIILQGSPVTSTARLATSLDEMVQAISNDVNAIGILPEASKTGEMTSIFAAFSAPVLAITSTAPDAVISSIITCMQ
jgi:hypothetical protein